MLDVESFRNRPPPRHPDRPITIVDRDEYDFDEIMRTALSLEKTLALSALDSEDFYGIYTSYYFQINSGLWVVPGPAGHDEAFRAELREARGRASFLAHGAATAHLAGKPLQPKWVSDLSRNLKNSPGRAIADLARRATFNFHHDFTLWFRSNGLNEIPSVEGSLLLKAYLKQLNGLAVGIHWQVLNRQLAVDKNALQCIALYCWFQKDHMHPGTLPGVFLPDPDSCELVRQLSKIQVTFVALHELAHCALSHRKSDWIPDPEIVELVSETSDSLITPDRRILMKEVEADIFAVRQLLQLNIEEPKDLRIVAVRLFFNYLMALNTFKRAYIEDSKLVGVEFPHDDHLRRKLIVDKFPVSSTTGLGGLQSAADSLFDQFCVWAPKADPSSLSRLASKKKMDYEERRMDSIEADTTYNGATADIFGAEPIAGRHITMEGHPVTLSLNFPPRLGAGMGETIRLILEWSGAGAIPTSILASWMYDKFKGKVRRLKIGNKSYRVQIDDLENLVEDLKKAHERERSENLKDASRLTGEQLREEDDRSDKIGPD